MSEKNKRNQLPAGDDESRALPRGKSQGEVPEARRTGRSDDVPAHSGGSGGSRAASGGDGDAQGQPPRRSRQSREPIHEAVPEAAPSAKFVHQFIPYMLFVLALFFSACFICVGLVDAGGAVGVIGRALNNFFCGLFGWPAFVLPLVLINLAVFWRKYVDMGLVPLKLSFSLLMLLVTSALVHVVTINSLGSEGFDIAALWRDGVVLRGGGVLGGLLGELSYRALGLLGSLIILIPMIGVLLMFLFGTTPRGIWLYLRYKTKVMAEHRQQRREAMENDETVIARRNARDERERERRELRQREKEEAKRRRHELLRRKDETDDDGSVFSEDHEVVVGNKDKKPPREGSIPIPGEDDNDTKQSSGKGTPTEGSIPLRPADPEPVPLTPAADDTPVGGGKPSDDKMFGKKTQIIEPVRRGSGSAYVDGLEQDPDYNDLNDIISGNVKPTPGGKHDDDTDNVDGVSGSSGSIPVTPARTTQAKKPQADEATVESMGMITDTDDISDLIASDDEEPIREQPTEYVFPPIDLLARDPGSSDDFAEELQDNAKRLMDTLRSFNDRIKEINYSRGPTITRYELKPDDGVRIRSIANLVDDIALSLATAGVRIEAPIPGKSAVGVEVPNKHQATVYLRTLVESPTFAESPSRLAVCLGEDVAGKPIYFNIDKMPHLLIAGATGMGKSVCINSIIISILYKAKPNEVKLILVDPKKVEFNIYKDIPHLYVPVVSDPKKAAGVLATAVAEMERRFELIESVNVRDINNYNKLAEGDPEIEPLPRIVIIIDELADLMMTASDDVETAICRLAQKARAAGIHLIIGTQRPSVDVITGLIKANVPSRIACKVSSQVDSRTIIDIGGAEKLIGRGDMLFAPVGAMKPLRVQGAFVGDMEVENIVEFIKQHNSEAHYDDEFIRRIEEEAAKCGSKKGGGGSATANIEDVDSEGVDPKLREAIELAIESGKISTSLMQRRLEVGYGRAAKILDQMEKLGYISAPDGNKPRRVLITKEQFMEKVINDNIDG